MIISRSMKKSWCVDRLTRLFSLTLVIFSVAGEQKSTKIQADVALLDLFSKSFNPEVATVSSDCQRDSSLYRNELADYKPWALQMYDSSTKISSGLITGSTKQLGNYDECLRVKTEHGFNGKACSAQVQFLVSDVVEIGNDKNALDMGDLLINVALASGLTNWTSGASVPYEFLWCVPSSCTARDVAETIEIGLDALKQSPRIDFIVTVNNNSCHTMESDRPILEIADSLYITLLILFGILAAISTVYDMVKQRNEEKSYLKETRHKIFAAFSVYTNSKSLFNVQRGPETIGCLDGLRFISICWIIYGHTHYLKIVGVQLDLLDVAKMHERWDTLLLLNGNVVTDTFFLLSGILLAYTEMRRKAKSFDRYSLNIWNLYVRRYLRLTPAYAIVIGFYATIFYKIGSGPHWNTWVGANKEFCVDNWWTNLLYVNNYVNVGDMCMSQSWYLSVDMQLIWLSPIFLYPMLGDGKRNQLIFLTLLGTGILASILAPLLITYFNSLTGTMLYYKNQMDVGEVYLQVYTRVYTRAAPYLLGLGLGYCLNQFKSCSRRIPTTVVVVGWISATVAGLAVVFGPRGMYFPNHDYNVAEAAFYAGFHRPVFALAVGWIVVACVFDCAGPVGALLSWSIWIPLSRLTYTAYLSHYIILLYNSGTIRSPEHLTTYGVVQTFFGNLAMTLIVSTILSLTFEIPFLRLSNLWASRCRCTTTKVVKPVVFPTSRSTLELYHSMENTVTPISRSYQDLMDRYAKVSVVSLEQPEEEKRETRNGEAGTSNAIDVHGTRGQPELPVESKVTFANSPRQSRVRYGGDNLGFEKTS